MVSLLVVGGRRLLVTGTGRLLGLLILGVWLLSVDRGDLGASRGSIRVEVGVWLAHGVIHSSLV